jgi:hypothetical protein
MKKLIIPFGLVPFLFGCVNTNYVEPTSQSSEGLLTYLDFSNVNQQDPQFNTKQFNEDKVNCSIAAATADIDGNDAATVGTQALTGAALVATSVVAAPVAILALPLSYGLSKLSSRSAAPQTRLNFLRSCLIEKGYKVDQKRK